MPLRLTLPLWPAERREAAAQLQALYRGQQGRVEAGRVGREQEARVQLAAERDAWSSLVAWLCSSERQTWLHARAQACHRWVMRMSAACGRVCRGMNSAA